MTIAPIVADIERAVMKPLRKKRVRRERTRCIYCEIVVDEAIPLKDGIEWEPWTPTPIGPVCDVCMADPLAEERVRASTTYSERRLTHNARCNRSLTQEQRAARNEEIIRLRAKGKGYAEIGELVGMSISGVSNALLTIRRRRDREIMRLVDLGWSRQRIANKVGLSPSMISKVIKRNRTPQT